MNDYTVTTKNGTVMQFYIKTVAELYQKITGGVLNEKQKTAPTPNQFEINKHKP